MSKMQKLFIGFMSVLLVVMLAIAGVNIQFVHQNQITKIVFTVGERVNAAGITPDYVGTDSATVQTALDNLPVVGGEIDLISPSYTFTAIVSRAINNVTFKGNNGTVISHDGVTALFSTGAQTGWKFQDLITDAGGITNFTTATIVNCTLGATTYTLRTPNTTGNVITASLTDSGLTNTRIPIVGAGGLLTDDADLTFTGGNTLNANIVTATTLNAPTGRGATYVIAASDATATEKAQADQVLAGTNDQVAINAELVTLNALGTHPTLKLIGDFTCNGAIVPQTNVDVNIQGSITITMTTATVGITFNNFTSSIWSGGTITRTGVINPVGLANTISITGTTDSTFVIQNMTVISTITDAVTEQNGAIRLVAGSPILRNLTVTSSDNATGAVSAGLLVGGFGNKPFIDGGTYTGGGGNQNCGIFFQDGTNARS